MRSQRGQAWAYLMLGVALVGAMGFGAYQTRLKNQYLRDAENKYMAAFHKLKWTSENIEERTAKLMATNDPRLQESLLADLRVFSAQAVEHMSTLPFTTMNTPRIANFLNTLRDQSDEKHHKLNTGQALDEADWAQLMELRKQAVFFEEELSNLLGLIGNNMIRWQPTVQATSPAQTGQAATPITKSVLALEQSIPVPPGEENALAPEKAHLPRPQTDLGPRVDAAAAAEAIKRFIDMPLKGEPVQTGVYDPEDKLQGLSLYYFDATKQNGLPMNFGVSVHGGHVIYMVDGRLVAEQKLKPDELIQKAMQMLARWGFPNVAHVSAAENDGTLVMEFAPVVDGVAIHTDMIRVSLAMDNGELVGYDARSYWVNHHDRQLPAPRLSADEAAAHTSPRLTVTAEPRLALIADRRGQERLVWEVPGRVEDQQFRVFVDAQDGTEVDLIRQAGDPAPPQ
ncbi:germination protein YpeB [Symbiobacterium terraclitae]|uniref:Germination protein YpeB n=1 Tax=Symbiobacterium terraclitae TaxID=557451 RepID=A0ABS4JV19_9FIRM|nr:germination protein YpeB [Symbiobacterium terraclitae]MBP2019393.1 germination protein YpeB [Symbiobacterium terraclitae]